MAGRVNSFAQFLTVLIIFIFVLFVTFYTSKFVAGYQKTQMQGHNMEVIDTIRLSNNKYAQIVRVGEKYVAIAVSKDQVTVLTEVPEEQIIIPQTMDATMGFKDLFSKVKEKCPGQTDKEEEKDNS